MLSSPLTVVFFYLGLAEKVKIIMNNREYQCVRRCLCLNLCRISRNLAGEMTQKWEANRKKRGFWGYFRPRLQSAAAAYSCRTAGKKFLCFSNILSFLHGFYAVLHTTTRLSCIYSLMTIFSADPIYADYEITQNRSRMRPVKRDRILQIIG